MERCKYNALHSIVDRFDFAMRVYRQDGFLVMRAENSIA